MGSQARRFQKPDPHIRHSAACNRYAKSNIKVCAASISVTMCPISGYHDIYLCNFAFQGSLNAKI
jgi:hypothetical protein